MPAEKPLHILHLTVGSDAGGISRYLLDLCAATQAQGHRITIAGEHGAWADRFRAAGFHWIEVPMKGGVLALRKSARILRTFMSKQPVDLLHAHYRRATLLGRKLQLQQKPPLLYTLHLSHLPMGWRRWLSDFGDHTHVASAQGRDWLLAEKLTTADRITLIAHGIDVARFPVASDADRAAARKSLSLSQEDRVAAYVGRFDYPKNVEWLLWLAERSRLSLPSLKLLLVGEGPEQAKFANMIATCGGLSDRVIMLAQRDPLPIYQAADAVLLASLREGFSLAAAEAMSVGTPVIRTNTSGTQELIVEGVTGRSTPIDREAFVSGAISFLSDAEKLREMGQNAAAHIRAGFMFDAQVQQTLRLYEMLVKP